MLYRLRKRYIINPCSDRGNCLVKASCRTIESHRCPDYKKFKKSDDFIDTFDDNLSVGIIVTVFLIGCFYILFTFGIGLSYQIKFIHDLF